MSGHFVDMNVRHPMLEEQQRRYPMDLRVQCPFCKAGPGKPCFMQWTHPSRSQEAKRQGIKSLTVNDLPNNIKKDLMEYCKANNIDPRTLHEASVETLFEYYCNWNGLINWAPKLIGTLNEMKRVKYE